MYTSGDFAIDPTNPKFRKTVGSEALLEETQRRHASREGKAERGAKPGEAAREQAEDEERGAGGGELSMLSRLVSSVKAKTKLTKKAKSMAAK